MTGHLVDLHRSDEVKGTTYTDSPETQSSSSVQTSVASVVQLWKARQRCCDFSKENQLQSGLSSFSVMVLQKVRHSSEVLEWTKSTAKSWHWPPTKHLGSADLWGNWNRKWMTNYEVGGG